MTQRPTFVIYSLFGCVLKKAVDRLDWMKKIHPSCSSQPSSYYSNSRAVGRSQNPGVPVLFGGHNLPPLVEIGFTDLPKFGGAMAPPAPPGTTPLVSTELE